MKEFNYDAAIMLGAGVFLFVGLGISWLGDAATIMIAVMLCTYGLLNIARKPF